MDILKKLMGYLMIVPTNESKRKIKKKYEELQINLRDLTRPINKSFDDYDEQYMKINFDSDDNFLLNKTIEIPIVIVVVRAVFDENNKYYPQVFFYLNVYIKYVNVIL